MVFYFAMIFSRFFI